MTSAQDREALAAAASTVGGVTVSPYFRQTTKPGDGMVRLDRQNRSSNGFGYMNTWQVLVMLPQDIAQAEKWLDDNLAEIRDALSAEMVVTTTTPQELVLDTGVRLPVVVIEGSRESGD